MKLLNNEFSNNPPTSEGLYLRVPLEFSVEYLEKLETCGTMYLPCVIQVVKNKNQTEDNPSEFLYYNLSFKETVKFSEIMYPLEEHNTSGFLFAKVNTPKEVEQETTKPVTKLAFHYLCNENFVEFNVAMENDNFAKAVEEKDLETARKILEQEF